MKTKQIWKVFEALYEMNLIRTERIKDVHLLLQLDCPEDVDHDGAL